MNDEDGDEGLMVRSLTFLSVRGRKFRTPTEPQLSWGSVGVRNFTIFICNVDDAVLILLVVRLQPQTFKFKFKFKFEFEQADRRKVPTTMTAIFDFWISCGAYVCKKKFVVLYLLCFTNLFPRCTVSHLQASCDDRCAAVKRMPCQWSGTLRICGDQNWQQSDKGSVTQWDFYRRA